MKKENVGSRVIARDKEGKHTVPQHDHSKDMTTSQGRSDLFISSQMIVLGSERDFACWTNDQETEDGKLKGKVGVLDRENDERQRASVFLHCFHGEQRPQCYHDIFLGAKTTSSFMTVRHEE